MKPLIAKIARKGGYTVILDAGQVLHAPDDLDVTDKLIRLYDKENP
jgi:Skp family chaperone for outer membrane proteins